jgi:homoaconitase/3-isopropylmalate dehydratase large subunit
LTKECPLQPHHLHWCEYSYLNPDPKAIEYAEKGRTPIQSSVIKCNFPSILTYDLSTIEPLLAVPLTRKYHTIEKKEFDPSGIGSCAGGRLDELRVVARILKIESPSSR